MRKYTILSVLFAAFVLTSCADYLNIQPKDKISQENLFSSAAGVELYMANLYSQLPVEDFNYMRDGFDQHYTHSNMVPAMFTEEATHSQYADHYSVNYFRWWNSAFRLLRDVNILSDAIPNLPIRDDEKAALEGAVSCIRCYTYFGLAKRYGGVPIITSTQQWEGDVDALKVPRATEKETWEYAISMGKNAMEKLPAVGNSDRRANKYVAAALTSRVALFAASVAKYGENVALAGKAVTDGLVGVEASAAEGWYKDAIEAAEMVILSGRYGLYMPNPASPEEAAENYYKLFTQPNSASPEVIFIKGYTVKGTGSNYPIFFQPKQTCSSWPHPGRMNPNLELVDLYESYGSHGESTPIRTSNAANDLTDYTGYSATKDYFKFDNPTDIFADKDARLRATVILPGDEFKKTKIIIQAGLIQQDGKVKIKSGTPYTWPVDGKTYYIYGAADDTQYSGFDPYGGNYTRTGFLLRKFMEDTPIDPNWDSGMLDWIDIRYAEVLLNYIEAVWESEDASRMSKALGYLNDIRRRAAFTEEISALSTEVIMRERLVELAFENQRFWDLIRRREFTQTRQNSQYHALLPILDLRGTEPKYIFIRSKIDNLIDFSFQDYMYYKAIPETGTNGLVQNPNF